jgi:hypothetical protein
VVLGELKLSRSEETKAIMEEFRQQRKLQAQKDLAQFGEPYKRAYQANQTTWYALLEKHAKLQGSADSNY